MPSDVNTKNLNYENSRKLNECAINCHPLFRTEFWKP